MANRATSSKSHDFVDPTLREGFVELEELESVGDTLVWKEKARWIKLEEDVEESANRWGKPHIPCVTFHSLKDLRTVLENTVIMLDLDRSDLPSLFEAVVDQMIGLEKLQAAERDAFMAILLTRHRHQNQRSAQSNYLSIKSISRRISRIGPSHSAPSKQGGNVLTVNEYEQQNDRPDSSINLALPTALTDITENQGGVNPAIQSKIPKNAEVTTVLVGAHHTLTSKVSAFVRLDHGCTLGNLAEVQIPVRFLFLLLGPDEGDTDYHEVGRSIGTLMSDKIFLESAYQAQSREDLLQSLDSFLGDCMIIPPGDWDKSVLNHTVPILLNQARELSVNRRRGAIKKNEVEPTMPETLQKDDTELDPLLRTGTCCGGLLRDIKRRFPFYLSDITDAFNTRCLMTIVFVYFACLAPAITFGGLLSEKTNAWMGVSEMILSTALCGTLYALFAGQPMIIIGATGPLLVFEKNTFELSERFGVEFLAWRAWVGLWVMVICFGIVALEGCFLIRYFTRFTEEIFACMISLIFIYDAFSYVWHEYESYPLTSRGAQYSHGDNCTSATSPSGLPTQSTANTALMATMLMLGTFFIAYGLRTLRHSHFFGQKARRIFSDLGVFIAIVAMVTIDWSASGVYTQKLAVPDGLGVTSPSKRGWFVNPMGEHRSMSPGWIFAALIPAILVSILIFMEIEFTNVILDKKDNKLKKGPGYNLDLFVAGLLVGLCSLLGLPWMCSTPVHTVSHFHALSVMSTNHAPGEHSHLVEVKEQRLTNAVIHLLIGLTVLVSPVLRHIPIAVLFGVFLYLGVSSLSHIQLCNRIRLLFIPASHHPDESYVRNVRTWKMHVFTVIQVACVCLLVAMKLTAAAPAFPFFIICMIPLRKLLERAFTDSELEELDHEFEDVYDSDMDEYDAVHVPL